jgi:hypothetical protein
MEVMSNGSTSHPEDNVPEEVQFVLNWNPPRFTARRDSEANANFPPNTARTIITSNIGYSRPAAFYDKHLASHLILERVVCLDTLVSAMASTVDQTIEDAISKHLLPKSNEFLQSARMIERYVSRVEWTPYHESGVAEISSKRVSEFCMPIASTLAIHPSSREWDAALVWTIDQTDARWAIADGVLRISTKVTENGHLMQQLLENEDAGTKPQ